MLEFDPMFNAFFTDMGIELWDARTTLTDPDDELTIPVIADCFLRFTRKEHERYELVAVEVVRGRERRPQIALPVPPHIPHDHTPLDVLRGLCEEYGQDIDIEDVGGRLIVNADLPHFKKDIEEVVHGYQEERGLQGYLGTFLTVRLPKTNTLKIVLAFFLDANKLKKGLGGDLGAV